jgi:NADPH:quinone reductase-like Zn-dependent oxidoreductase
MKAIHVRKFGGPEVLRLEDVPELRPGPGEIVVRVKAAGVNPVDAYIRSSTYARKPTLPYTPGADAAGVVESVGEGVARVAAGDRMYLAGDAMGRDAAILGMTLFNVSERDAASIHAALVAGLENGRLRPVVGQELPLAEAPRAHRAVMQPGAYGKIVLVP